MLHCSYWIVLSCARVSWNSFVGESYLEEIFRDKLSAPTPKGI